MEFTKEEFGLIKGLIQRELKSFKEKEEKITMGPVGWFAQEEKYEEFLEELLKKFR